MAAVREVSGLEDADQPWRPHVRRWRCLGEWFAGGEPSDLAAQPFAGVAESLPQTGRDGLSSR
ncbi:hypothetical protein [Actinophytocola sp.]|uniref:hypothetical protein n=1 Tax=Actinophytocola sp. TaxID=1872138 RepID=UPI003D6C491C